MKNNIWVEIFKAKTFRKDSIWILWFCPHKTKNKIKTFSGGGLLYLYNNREDGVDDSNLYFQLTSISIYIAYIPQIGHAD